MKAVIIDPSHDGHHLQYVRVLADALHALGVEVDLLLDCECVGSEEAEVHLKDLANGIVISDVIKRLQNNRLSGWADIARDIRGHLSRRTADRAFFPYFDGLAQVYGLPWTGVAPLDRSLPAEVLIMRGAWAYPSNGRTAKLRTEISRRLAMRGPWETLHFVDPLPYLTFQGHRLVREGRIRVIPEAVEPPADITAAEARRALGLPETGRWLVMPGMQERRKGSAGLVEAFLKADPGPDAHLLLAGKAKPGFADELRAQAGDALHDGRVFFLDRYLTAEEFSHVLDAADFLAAPHSAGVGSSGVVVRAAQRRKPLLATDLGWIGWAVDTFGLGTTVNTADPATYTQAITALFDQPPSTTNDRTERFARYHRLDNHLAHWLADTRKILGLPPDPNLNTWDSLFSQDEIEPPRWF